MQELGKIIQKDFFPDLEKLKAQNDYLDAMGRNDFIKIREIQAKYSGRTPLLSAQSVQGKKPFYNIKSMDFRFSNFLLKCIDSGETPASFETPQIDVSDTESVLSSTRSKKRRTPSTTSSVTSSKSPSDGHSLDSFLTNYTSEDNNSFQDLIETADKKLRQKFAVLFEAEDDTAAAIAHSLALPSIENQYKAIEGSKQVCVKY